MNYLKKLYLTTVSNHYRSWLFTYQLINYVIQTSEMPLTTSNPTVLRPAKCCKVEKSLAHFDQNVVETAIS